MRVIALPGEKGGIGKTTTTVNLGAALVEMGRRVLLLDTDPQASCSRSVGVAVSDPARSLYAALSGQASLTELIVKSPTCDIFVVPAHRRLATIGVEITIHPDTRLRKALLTLPQDAYDYVLIDCPPRLDLLPINAITAAGEVLIPLTLEVLPTHTLPTLMRTINEVRTFGDNPDLRVLGIVPCMTTRGRTRLEREIRRVLPQLVNLPIYSGIRKAEVIRDAVGIVTLFGQHPWAAEDLGLLFHLDPHEVAELVQLAKGETLLLWNHDVHVPLYVPLPPDRADLYKTDPEQQRRAALARGVTPVVVE